MESKKSSVEKLELYLREHTELLDEAVNYTENELMDIYESSTLYADDKLLIHEGKLFEVLVKEDMSEYGYMTYVAPNENGMLDYIVMYYNGGTSFSEALEDAVNTLTP